MTAIIQADYDQLETVASSFAKAAEATNDSQKRLQQALSMVEASWQGVGSKAFFAEMRGEVLPTLQRLIEALQEGQRTTLAVSKQLSEAEHEAAQLFKGDGQTTTPAASAAPPPVMTNAAAFTTRGDPPSAASPSSGSSSTTGGGGGSSAGSGTSGSGGGSSGGGGGSGSGGGNSSGGGSSSSGGGGSSSSGGGSGSGGTTTPTEPTAPPTDAPPQQDGPLSPSDATEHIGELAEYHESSGRGPGTVSGGAGDPGGVSYGKHQLSSKTGTAAAFVNSPEGAAYRDELGGLKPGSKAFSDQWKAIAARDPEGFGDAQYRFIKRTHYDPEVQQIFDATGLNPAERSHAVRSVLYSVSVQHGKHASTLVTRALRGQNVSAMSDDQVINAIYDERSRINPKNGRLAYFQSTTSKAWQRGLRNRFTLERRQALQIYQTGSFTR